MASDAAAKPPQLVNKWYESWIEANLKDQSGKVVIVTGSNSGTGYWCVDALAGAGATVVLACRSVDKANAAREEIIQRHPAAKLDVIPLDNSDLSTVRSFAEAFKAKYDRLDILANNAGVAGLPYDLTKDGFEVQFQTNHLAHFYLTQLLWDVLLATPGQGRVIQHSSSMHGVGSPKFDKDNMEFPKHGWQGYPFRYLVGPAMGMTQPWNWMRYGVSKLCNVLFMRGLQKRIEAKDLTSKVISLACHPGYASTGIQSQAGKAGSLPNHQHAANDSYAQTAADGSLPLLMACVDERVCNGDFLGPMGFGEDTGPPGKRNVKGYGNDPQQAADCWAYSEECLKIKFEV